MSELKPEQIINTVAAKYEADLADLHKQLATATSYLAIGARLLSELKTDDEDWMEQREAWIDSLNPTVPFVDWQQVAWAAEQRAQAAEAKVERLREALKSIIIRCTEGDKRTNWLPTITSIAAAAITATTGQLSPEQQESAQRGYQQLANGESKSWEQVKAAHGWSVQPVECEHRWVTKVHPINPDGNLEYWDTDSNLKSYGHGERTTDAFVFCLKCGQQPVIAGGK